MVIQMMTTQQYKRKTINQIQTNNKQTKCRPIRIQYDSDEDLEENYFMHSQAHPSNTLEATDMTVGLAAAAAITH